MMNIVTTMCEWMKKRRRETPLRSSNYSKFMQTSSVRYMTLDICNWLVVSQDHQEVRPRRLFAFTRIWHLFDSNRYADLWPMSLSRWKHIIIYSNIFKCNVHNQYCFIFIISFRCENNNFVGLPVRCKKAKNYIIVRGLYMYFY